MDQEQKSREQSFISELVPDWRPARKQVLWATRLAIAIAVVLVVIVIGFGVRWLWEALANYIDPQTPAQRTGLTNSIALIGAGVVGFLTAFAAVVNLYFARHNLENAKETLRQQRDSDERHAQDDALRSYLEQLGHLVIEQELPLSDQKRREVLSLARAQTLAVLRRLDASSKWQVLSLLHGADLLVRKGRLNVPAIDLTGADLSGAVLSNTDLRDAVLGGVILSKGTLSNADLRGANLRGADLRKVIIINSDFSYTDLSDANLRGADLRGTRFYGAYFGKADLRDAILIDAQGLSQDQLRRETSLLEGTILPNGQKYEDWLKSKSSGEDGEKPGPS